MSTQKTLTNSELLARFQETHPEIKSIAQIISITEEDFVNRYASELTDGEHEARRIYRTALAIQEQQMLIWANIKDAVASPYFRGTLFNNIPQSFIDHIQSIPGYDKLFGSLDFIECDHCRSIFGPAAYFVDLMRFIDKHIVTPDRNDIIEEHKLKKRRPDIFELKLDCNNTFNLIPYIDIVNEVLEGVVREAETPDPYYTASTDTYPFELPFHLPVTEIRAYLEKLKTSLQEIYRLFGQVSAEVAREILVFSPLEWNLLSKPRYSFQSLSEVYGGLDLQLRGRNEIDDLNKFLEVTGITRTQLNELIFQDLSYQELIRGQARLFVINQVEDGLPPLDIAVNKTDSANPFEYLTNLSLRKLDRIHRFIRLSDKLDWSYTDLDWAIRSLYPPFESEKCLVFDGINDYVHIDLPNGLNLKEFTFEAWIQPNRSGVQAIFTKTNSADPRHHFMIYLDINGKLAFYVYDSVTNSPHLQSVSGETKIPVGELTHIAVVVTEQNDAENLTIQLFVNGYLDQNPNALVKIPGLLPDQGTNNQQFISLGKSIDAYVSFEDDEIECINFQGLIKEVRLWDGERTAEEIAQYRFRRFNGNESNLIGYWPLEECYVGKLIDYSFNQNHGKIGGDTFVTQPVWGHADLVIDALPNRDFTRFNGIDQYLAIREPAGIPENLADLSVEAWIHIKLDELAQGTKNTLIYYGNSTGDAQFHIWINDAGKLVFENKDISAQASTNEIPSDQPTHLALVVTNGGLNFYINGIPTEPAPINISSSNLLHQGAELRVGWSNDTDYFKGQIRELRLWNTARSEDELNAFMHAPLFGEEEGLLGYWRMNQLENGISEDRSLNQNHLLAGGYRADYMPTRTEEEWLLPALPIEEQATVLQFNKDSFRLQMANPRNEGLGKHEQFTLEFWFKSDHPERTEQKQLLYTQGDGEAGISIYLFDRKLYVYAWCTDFEQENIEIELTPPLFTNIPDNDWHYLTLVYDRAYKAFDDTPRAGINLEDTQFALYLDGQQKDQQIANLVLSPVGDAFMGGIDSDTACRFHDGLIEEETHHFYGQITDFRLWKKVRSPEEIAKDAQVNDRYVELQGWEDGLLAYFPLTEGYGSTVSDHSGPIYDQTSNLINGELRYGPDDVEAKWGRSTAPIDYGEKVLVLDGEDDFVVLNPAHELSITESGFSFEAWIKLANLDGIHPIISTWSEGGNSCWLSVQNAKLAFGLGTQTHRGQTSLEADIWYHIACTFEMNQPQGGKVQLFINGEKESTQTATGFSALRQLDHLYIGHRRFINANQEEIKQYFQGEISEVRIWSEARSETALKEHLQNRLNGDEEHLAAYWVFDHDSRFDITDRSPQAHHALLKIGEADDIETKWKQALIPIKQRDLVLSLDGGADFISLPEEFRDGLKHSSHPNISGSFTLECWIKLTQKQTEAPLWASRSQIDAPIPALYLALVDGIPQLSIGEEHYLSDIQLKPQQWYHLAWRYDQTNMNCSLWLNGQQVYEITDLPNIQIHEEEAYTIGYLRRWVEAQEEWEELFLHADISSLRFWGTARSAADIKGCRHDLLEGNEADLLAYYLFNEDASFTLTDLSIHARHAALFVGQNDKVAPKWVESDSPFAYRHHKLLFNGETNYVTLGNVEDYGIVDHNFTIEIWVKPLDTSAAEEPLIGTVGPEHGDANNKELYLSLRYGEPHMGFRNDDETTATEIEEGVWTHLAFRYFSGDANNSSELAVFVDGEKKAFRKNVAPFMGTGPLHIGYWLSTKNGWHPARFTGEIAEVRIWNISRIDEDIVEYRYGGINRNEDGLVGFYTFFEGEGTQIQDLSPAGNHGTLTLEEDIDPNTLWAEIDADELPELRSLELVFEMDGQDDYIQLSDIENLINPQEDFTIESWINTPSPEIDQILLGTENESGLQLGIEGELFFVSSGGEKAIRQIALVADQWHHLVCRYDNSTQQLEVILDGIVEVAETIALPNSPVLGGGFYLGRGKKSGSYQYFNGKISNLRIWKGRRTDEQLEEFRTVRLNPDEHPELTAYWAFNEAEKYRLIDHSPNRLHAHLHIPTDAEVTDQFVMPVPPMGYMRSVFSFDGHNDYATLAHLSELGLIEHDFTLETWLQIPDTLDEVPVLGTIGPKEDLQDGGFYVKLRDRKVLIGNYQTEQIATNLELNANEWYHLAWTYYHANQELKLLVDGKEVFSTSVSFQLTGESFLCLGHIRTWNGSEWECNHFPNCIRELRIWNETRSADQIKRHRYDPLLGTESGLTGYWVLDEEEQYILHDRTHQEQHAFLSIHTIDDPDTKWEESDAPIGQRDWAVVFDGQNDRIRLNGDITSHLKNNDFTVEAWVRVSDLGQAEEPILGTKGPQFGPTQNREIYLTLRYGEPHMGFRQADDTSSKKIEADKWVHIAWRYHKERGEQAIFIDGILEEASSYRTPFIGDGELYIGYWLSTKNSWQGAFFTGEIREVRIWNAAIEDDLIAERKDFRLIGNEDNLLAYYRLDEGEGNVVNNLSSAGETYEGELITETGVDPNDKWELVEIPAQEVSTVFLFDGIDDYIELPKTSDLGLLSGDFTVEAWVNFAHLPESGEVPVLSSALPADPNDLQNKHLNLGLKDGKLLMSFGENAIQGSTAIASDEWHHLVWRYTAATQEQALFLNGRLEFAEQGHAPFLKDSVALIGLKQDWDDYNDEIENDYLTGKMADFRIWNKSRTEAEIRFDMLYRMEGAEEGLAAYYVFDEEDGLILRDRTASGLDGEISIHTIDELGPKWIASDAPIHYVGHQLYFDGYNDYIDLGSGLNPNGKPWTIECWFHAKETAAKHTLFNKMGLFEAAVDEGCLAFTWAPQTEKQEAFVVEKDTWYHVLITYDGTHQRVYKNGVFAFSIESTAMPSANNEPLWIGLHHQSVDEEGRDIFHHPFLGYIDEFRVWNRTFTEDEISERWATLPFRWNKNLLGYWPFDEGKGGKVGFETGVYESNEYHAGDERPEDKWVLTNHAPIQGTQSVLLLDGKDDHVEIGNNLSTQLHHSFTIEAWIYISAFNENAIAILGSNSPENGHKQNQTLIAGLKGAYPYLSFYENDLISNQELKTEVWYHIAWSYNLNSQQMSIYVNGQLHAQSSHHDAFSGIGTIYIGQWQDWNTERGVWKPYLFNGLISEVRVWNRSQSSETIQELMNQRLVGNEHGLLAYWIFDEERINHIPARYGYRNNLYQISLRNDRTHQQPIWTSITDRPLITQPLPKRALEFDGVGDYMANEALDHFNPEQFTIEAWITVVRTLALKDILRQLFNISLPDSINLTDSIEPQDDYTHLALTVDMENGNLIVNGTSSFPIDWNQDYLQTQPWLVGKEGYEAFEGKLRAMRLWSTARMTEEIAENRYTRVAQQHADLISSWYFEEKADELVSKDESIGQNHLQLGGLSTDRHPDIVYHQPVIIANNDFWQQDRLALTLYETAFEGIAQIEIPTYALSDQPHRQQRTIEVWFRADDISLPRKQVIYQESDGERHLSIYVQDYRLYFEGYNKPNSESGWNKTVLSTEKISSEKWHHAAIILDGRDEVRPHSFCAYLDGKWIGIAEGSQLWGLKGTTMIGGVIFEPGIRDEVLKPYFMGHEDVDVEHIQGDWKLSGQVLNDRNRGKGEKSIRFIPNESTPAGKYRIGLRYPADARHASNVPVRIKHQNGESTVVVNQQENALPFFELGVFFLGVDEAERTITIETTGTNGFVIADSIVLEKLADLKPTELYPSILDENHYLQGQILEIRIWDTVFTADQLWERYILTDTNHLIFHWNWQDATANAYIQSIDDFAPNWEWPRIRFDAQTLEGLASIKELKDQYRLSIDKLTALWYAVKHTGKEDDKTLYDSIFNSSSKIAAWPYYINPGIQWELNGNRTIDRETRAKLAAALRVSDKKLNQIIQTIYGEDVESILINQESLGNIYRLSDVSKRLKINLEDLLQLLPIISLSGVNTLTDFMILANRIEWLKSSKLSVEELDFIINDVQGDNTSLSLDEVDIINLADSLVRQSTEYLVKDESFVDEELGLGFAQSIALKNSLNTENLVFVDEAGNVIHSDLSGWDIPPRAQILPQLMMNASVLTSLEIDANSASESIEHLISEGFIDEFGNFLDKDIAIWEIPINVSDSEPIIAQLSSLKTQQIDAREVVRVQLEERLAFMKQLQEDAIYTGLADVLNSSADILRVLLTEDTEGIKIPEFQAEMERIFQTQAVSNEFFQFLYRLFKLHYIIDTFDMLPDEARRYLSSPASFGMNGTIENPLLEDIESLNNYQQLKQYYRDRDGQFLNLLATEEELDLDASSLPDMNRTNLLVNLTDWPSHIIPLLRSHLKIKTDYYLPAQLIHMHQIIDLAEARGIDVVFLIELADTSHIDYDEVGSQKEWEIYKHLAAATHDVLQARFEEDQWEKAYQPIRDELAIQKRDALTTLALEKYTANFEGRKSPDILYEYLLIDVQMSSETQTSRIRQALSSLQLYVQRCQMNLEKDISLDSSAVKEWEWVKNYRVWEANRKVFLYPENYIEPELRDTKTPFFKELEEELMQEDINQESVEKAYINYMDKFKDVSNLKIVGSYFDAEKNENGDTTDNGNLYLIGRTRKDQVEHYVRIYRKIGETWYWEPWQRIDLTIDASYVTPVYAFNRLYIFWPEFEEERKTRDKKIELKHTKVYRNKTVTEYKNGIPEEKVYKVYVKTIVEPADPSQLKHNEKFDKKTGYVRDEHNVLVKENYTVYKPQIKLSYQNVGDTWIQPQIFEKYSEELSEADHLKLHWQRIYAQRTRRFFQEEPTQPNSIPEMGAQVLKMGGRKRGEDESARRRIISFVDRILPDINTSQITISFWTKFVNPDPNGSLTNIPTKQANIFWYYQIRPEPAGTISEDIVKGLYLLNSSVPDEDGPGNVDVFAKAFLEVRVGNNIEEIIGKDEAFNAIVASREIMRRATSVLNSIGTIINGTPPYDTQVAQLRNFVNSLIAYETQVQQAITDARSVDVEITDIPADIATSALASIQEMKNAGNIVINTPTQSEQRDKNLSIALANFAHGSVNLANESIRLADSNASQVAAQAVISAATQARNAANQNPANLGSAYAETNRALIQVLNILNEAHDIESNRPKWISPDAYLEIVLLGKKFRVLDKISYDPNPDPDPYPDPDIISNSIWNHIALTLNYSSNSYSITFILNDVEIFDEMNPIIIPMEQFPNGESLSFGLQPNIIREYAGEFQIHLSEFRWWNYVRSSVDIKESKELRMLDSELGLFHIPFNNSDLGDDIELVPSNLNFTQVLPEIIEINERERIFLLYGKLAKSLRVDLKDYTFDLELKSPASQPHYDLNISFNSLYVTKTYKILFDEYSPYSDSSSSLIRLPIKSLLFLSEYVLKKPNDEYKNRIDKFHRSRFRISGTRLLNKLNKYEVSITEVHNQPGWYIFDTGEEHYFINIINRELKTAEDRMSSASYNDRIYDDRAQPVSLVFNPDPALDAGNSPLPEFKFERISTYSIHHLIEKLFKGVDKLLTLDSQLIDEFDFDSYYTTSFDLPVQVHRPYYDSMREKYSIDFDGAYGAYYWEVFFHIPFLVANRLNTNQKFQEAQKWYHYIFNPIVQSDQTQSSESNDRYWHFLPFLNLTARTLMDLLVPTNPDALRTLNIALERYRKDPFDPHAIATLRITAYQKAIVMKYIDNLLDWGDYLFQQDTRESINEAIPLYVLAFNLLGPRPKSTPIKQFKEMGDFDGFSIDEENIYEGLDSLSEELEALRMELKLEGLMDFLVEDNPLLVNTSSVGTMPFNPNYEINTKFCLSENEEFVAYWDRVEDRLFKIRHSLNFEGIFRSLALFEPPIDPRLLVEAVAGGRGIASALADLRQSIPHYHFMFMLDRAKNIASQVISFGGTLLSVLEKKDAEALALLRNKHERNILKLTTSIREDQLNEAKENLEALQFGLLNAQTRQQHYAKLVDQGLSALEIANLVLTGATLTYKAIQQSSQIGATVSYSLPIFETGGAGAFGSPFATVAIGGETFGRVADSSSNVVSIIGEILSTVGQMVGTMAGYERRSEDWQLQETLATHDIDQIEKQIEAARLRIQIAQGELKVHEKNIQQNQEIEDFYRRKFTNEALYGWMINRISGLYFQAYKMAYDMAKAVEKSMQFELPTTESYVSFGHWDSLKKGLLSGESLMLDLIRMEKAYLEKNSRFLEIEKTISLVQIDPMAFLQLKQTGSCEFELSERLFDHDYPGHYCRMIKSVALSIPAIVGPYQTIKATFTQISSHTLLKPDVSGLGYLMGMETDEVPDETIVRSNWRANQQIAISRGINDAGLFQLNFNDERFLPFEGTGAVSRWRLEMPKATNPFDFESLTDVIIHLNYMAKSDAGSFKQEVQSSLADFNGYRLINITQEFSAEWHAFMNPAVEAPESLDIQFTQKMFPPNLTNLEMIEYQLFSLNKSGELEIFDDLINLGVDEFPHLVQLDVNRVDLGEFKTLMMLIRFSGSLDWG